MRDSHVPVYSLTTKKRSTEQRACGTASTQCAIHILYTALGQKHSTEQCTCCTS